MSLVGARRMLTAGGPDRGGEGVARRDRLSDCEGATQVGLDVAVLALHVLPASVLPPQSVRDSSRGSRGAHARAQRGEAVARQHIRLGDARDQRQQGSKCPPGRFVAKGDRQVGVEACGGVAQTTLWEDEGLPRARGAEIPPLSEEGEGQALELGTAAM